MRNIISPKDVVFHQKIRANTLSDQLDYNDSGSPPKK